MTDVELANELDAQKRILAHGYTKEKCPMCMGTGWLYADNPIVKGGSHSESVCFGCNGKGYKWKAPII